MSILLILGAMPEDSPYINYYTNILDRMDISYDICAWNRYRNNYIKRNNLYVFTTKGRNSAIKKVFGYLNYRKYILKHVRNHAYDHVVVFTITSAFFLNRLLTINFKHKYIFDIRDYSSLLRFRYVKKVLKNILSMSYANVISSPGFRYWLPHDFKYTISHNVAVDNLSYTDTNNICPSEKIKILTIGALRDSKSNIELIKSLGDNSHFFLQFTGRGSATPIIQEYINLHKLNNAIVTGQYNKADEGAIVKEFDMINILLPHNMVSDYLMSNRFYLSVVYGKPMIVNNNCTQAYFVKKYNLGVIIDNKDDIAKIIKEYWNYFDVLKYNKGRADFLNIIKNDERKFKMMLENFIEDK